MKRYIINSMIGLWSLGSASAAILYVDGSAGGANDGSSWANAFTNLQTAIDAAEPDTNIWLTEGVYYPPNTDLGRAAAFHLKDGVKIYGGFPSGGADFDQRNPVVYRSILTGDLNDDDAGNPESYSDNCYHVLVANDAVGIVLDGLEVTGGNADGAESYQQRGGGFLANGSATIVNCRFFSNRALDGGGLYCCPRAHAVSAITLRDCRIEFNQAAIEGGGVYLGDSNLLFENCSILGNHAGQRGGGIMFGNDNVSSLTGCHILENSAGADGGGMYLTFSFELTITECEISRNQADGKGGGVYHGYDTYLTCRQSTFLSNTALGDGGAVYHQQGQPDYGSCRFKGNHAVGNGGAVYNQDSDGKYSDCLFQGNDAWQGGGLYQMQGIVIVNNSYIQLNQAMDFGGGIYLLGADSEIYQCVFVRNRGSDMGGQGGAIWSGNSNLRVIQSTLEGNWADDAGSGIYNDVEGYLTIVNSIIRDSVWNSQGAWWSYSHSNVGDFADDETTISEDPLYQVIPTWGVMGGEAGGLGDLRLRPGSPCINTSDNSVVSPGATDLDGRPRILDGRVDMGAYEYEYKIPAILYVDDSAVGANNGTSWQDAYLFLQDALAAARAKDEIRVAQGTYRPDQSAYLDGLIEGDRIALFQLKSGVPIRGGYAGNGAANPDEWDINRYETILSGDLNGDDGPVFSNNSENSYHVLRGIFVDSAVLDGFTITAGNASHESNWYHFRGAGLFVYHSSLSFLHCTFRSNYAGNHDGGGSGGAVYSMGGSPMFIDCRFFNNYAVALDGGEGSGGAFSSNYGPAMLTNCSFFDNVSGRDGGAVFCEGSDLMIVNGLFAGNIARLGGSGSRGGVIYSFFQNLFLINCTFANNTARSELDDPYADYGGALFIGYSTGLTMWNSILWGNSARYGSQIFLTPHGTHAGAIGYCDIQGGWPGQGNLDVEPLFANAADGDYRLKSQAGRWDANAKVWVQDAMTSPCIDAGDPYGPIGLEPFPNGGVVNMGFDGGTTEASKSWFGGDCAAVYAGDVNGDCRVDLADLAILSQHWLRDGSGPR